MASGTGIPHGVTSVACLLICHSLCYHLHLTVLTVASSGKLHGNDYNNNSNNKLDYNINYSVLRKIKSNNTCKINNNRQELKDLCLLIYLFT